MTAEYDRGNSLAEVMDRLPPEDRERLAEVLRHPQTYFAGNLSDTLAILDQLRKK